MRYILTTISKTGLDREREREIKQKSKPITILTPINFNPFKLTRGIKLNIILQLLIFI